MIEVKNLTQIYKSGKGVFDLDFKINEGEVFGYLGPNGAGKTTTIRNILGFANATEGGVTILGKEVRHNSKIQTEIGYLPGEMTFFENFSGIEFLDFMSNMRGTEDKTKRDELIKRFELDVNMPIRKMSKGMKQKVGIVTAFMHDPKILILDEPTSGLDPLMQKVFMDLLVEEKALGKTILMSSHIFEEVEKVCDRAGIIKDGRLITIEDFSSLHNKKEDMYEIEINGDSKLLVESNFDVVSSSNNVFEVRVKSNLSELLGLLSKLDVVSINKKSQSIEEIFMKYYSKEAK
jgi:ABC-2 type transport system ATP-binding protein